MVLLILLATVLLGSVARAHVRFEQSEVLQESDIPDFGDKANFKCDNGCRVYTDSRSSRLYITKLNSKTGVFEAITTFSNIGGADKQNPIPYVLKPSFQYYIDNRGDLSPFVFYVVDNEAFNIGAPVMVITDEAGLHINTTAERVTVLSGKAAAHTWSKYRGVGSTEFLPGFPMIYATGFDNVDVDYCWPAFVARSPESLANSAITLPTPISTIHFGTTARHTIEVAWNRDATVEHTQSTVYVTPGFHGCSMNEYESYPSSLNASLSDSFTINAKNVHLSGYLNLPYDLLRVQVNDLEMNFHRVYLTPQCFSDADTYAISLEWKRRNLGASFAIQFDFNSTECKP